MEPRVAAFEEELNQRKERYNTVFAMARRSRPGLDGELFKHNLRTLVAPILAEMNAELGKPLVEPLYDLCLELTGNDLFRRSPAVLEVWQRLLPQAVQELVEAPSLLPAALTNAAYNLEREETAHLDFWVGKMERCRGLCGGAGRWLQVGQIMAWRCGMAHYRESAIALGNSLPEGLREGLRHDLWPDWEQDIADPWHALRLAENGTPSIIRRVGSFQGFGGRFRQPPWVAYAGSGRFLVEDGTESWILSADAFGATLKPGTAEILDSARADLKASAKGKVQWGQQSLDLPELGPVRSSAASQHVLAVTSEHSHQLFLILGPHD
jgi:hypothetical protein